MIVEAENLKENNNNNKKKRRFFRNLRNYTIANASNPEDLKIKKTPPGKVISTINLF